VKCPRNFNGKIWQVSPLASVSTDSLSTDPLKYVCPQSSYGVSSQRGSKQIQLGARMLLWLLAKLPQFIHALTDDIRMHRCVFHLVVSKMTTAQDRARCVDWLFETKSVIQTKWNYRTHMSINHLQSKRQPNTSNGDFWKLVASMIVQEVVGSCEWLCCAATSRSPVKSTRRA